MVRREVVKGTEGWCVSCLRREKSSKWHAVKVIDPLSLILPSHRSIRGLQCHKSYQRRWARDKAVAATAGGPGPDGGQDPSQGLDREVKEEESVQERPEKRAADVLGRLGRRRAAELRDVLHFNELYGRLSFHELYGRVTPQ